MADFFKQLSPYAGPSGGGDDQPAVWGDLSPTSSRTFERPSSQEQTWAHSDSERRAVTLDEMPPVLQLHRTYLVCETPDGMVIVDQHALHERIIYEQLKSRIAGGKLESQRLLIPEVVRLTARHVTGLEANRDLLEQLGIELTLYGDDTVAVQSFPALLHPEQIPEFIGELSEKLADRDATPTTEVLIHQLLDMMACKAAVKAGDSLTPEEMKSLILQRQLVEKSSNCPHGRPTTLRLSLSDLERQFKRT